MKKINNRIIPESADVVIFTSATDNKSPVEYPRNCSDVGCPYGRDRAFCFPCYARILDEHREAKRQRQKRA